MKLQKYSQLFSRKILIERKKKKLKPIFFQNTYQVFQIFMEFGSIVYWRFARVCVDQLSPGQDSFIDSSQPNAKSHSANERGSSP